jgi:transposase
LALRARIVLACASGLSNKAVATRERVSVQTVGKWRRRFIERGLDGLLDEPRPGVPRKIDDAVVESVIVRTLESQPPAATHWSTRSMARHSGISTSIVGRIWRAFGLQPHRSETFKLSTDPLFVDKSLPPARSRVRDVVGLYINPPDRALVLCVDEKPQIQSLPLARTGALDRTQPLLPMRPGQVERRSHDYQRHGTTSLFAALDIATGQVIGRCYQRHRALEFRKFLAAVEQAVPADLDIHLVLDNYATHKAPPVRAWLARHPRDHLHFTPTSASWLNQVERWLALLACKQIKRGIHRSVHELKTAIAAFIQAHNADPKPFIWTKTADAILHTIGRYCSDTLAIHAQTC